MFFFFLFLRGGRGSIRGSGHVAQTQVIEGKEEEEEEQLEAGGGGGGGGGWRVEGLTCGCEFCACLLV